MKLFIDSSQAKFVAAIIENNKSIFKSLIETKYKVEEIIHFFDKCPFLDQINEIYINLGPGSFVGSRAALIYIRTILQIKNHIQIFTTNTFLLLEKQKPNKLFLSKKFYIPATKNKSYVLSRNKIDIVEKKTKETEINYDDILNNFSHYNSCFKKENVSALKPIYASEPQIGERK